MSFQEAQGSVIIPPPPEDNFGLVEPTLSQRSNDYIESYCSSQGSVQSQSQSLSLSQEQSQSLTLSQSLDSSFEVRRTKYKTETDETAIIVKNTLSALGKAIGINRLVGYKSWTELTEQTQRRKANALLKVINNAALPAIAGSDRRHQAELRQLMRLTPGPVIDAGLINVLTDVSNEYTVASDFSTRTYVLSLVAKNVPYSLLSQFISGLTHYQYTAARKYAALGRPPKADVTRMRYKPDHIKIFIEFITQPFITMLLPFGETKATTSDGSKTTVPSTVRSFRNERIYQMYKRYMDESEQKDKKLSRSTVINILDAIPAKKRKSTRGLNYFQADGTEAMDDLTDVVNIIGNEGFDDDGIIDGDWAAKMKRRIAEAKSYLLSDYNMHIKTSSRVADHCIQFALSDPNMSEHALSCADGDESHQHDLLCDRCEALATTLTEIETTAYGIKMDDHLKRELEERIIRSKNKIDLWKRHLVRRAEADMVRNSIIDNMGPDEVLLVLDWSMKLPLPMKYHEKQDDWFGKSGCSIHISYALWRWPDVGYQYMVFVHVLREKEDQSSEVVMAILDDTFQQLKFDNVNKVYIRSDQAGCYKSSINIAGMNDLMERTGVKVKMVTFSEAQAGKSLCDTYSSVVKNKLLDFVSSGGNVQSPEEIMTALDWGLLAMESKAGEYGEYAPLGIRTRLIEFSRPTAPLTDPKKKKKPSIPQMKTLNAFEFNDDQVQAWRYRTIGKGKTIEKKYLSHETAQSLSPVVNNLSLNYRWGRRHTVHDEEPTVQQATEHTDEDVEQDMENPNERLYVCPEPNCIKTYMSHGNLIKHMETGKHVRKPVKKTLTDFALEAFKNKLEGIRSEHVLAEVRDAYAEMSVDHKSIQRLQQGWALPPKYKSARFTDNQREFLDAIFNEGALTKKKLRAKQVEKQMKSAVIDGQRRFLPDEVLAERQISSYFSRRHQEIQRQCAVANKPLELCQVEDNPTEEGDPTLDFEVYKLFVD